jgi:hypothetical protein
VFIRVFTGLAWQRVCIEGIASGGQRFRVCAAAFAINGVAACSVRALAGGGWAFAPPSMASFPARGQP